MKVTGITAVKVLDWESEFGRHIVEASPGLGLTVKSRNVNIPWPDQGMGDGDYMHAFQKVVMPIAVEFDPDLVISSF